MDLKIERVLMTKRVQICNILIEQYKKIESN